jgi:1-aminocyclopropane-1-carboxylate deaminase/D-cysteine desulfhydrase-like pyridoxal-dependent ACC family enzyme
MSSMLQHDRDLDVTAGGEKANQAFQSAHAAGGYGMHIQVWYTPKQKSLPAARLHNIEKLQAVGDRTG